MDAKTYLMVLNLNEGAEDIAGHFGTSGEAILKLINGFIDIANNEVKAPEGEKTFHERMLALVDRGEIDGGLLMTLATMYVVDEIKGQLQRTVMKRMAKDLLGHILDDEEEEDTERGL